MFLEVGSGLLGGASVMIAASWGETVDTTVSSTLENRGDKMTVPVAVAIKQGWGDVSGRVMNVGWAGCW